MPDARSSVRYAVERINKLLAKDNGFLLEAIGSEDVSPGRNQRAQEIINQYVDVASIFIGILHRRFGQSTGVAESGTEEEFNRIDKRWENEKPKPEIMMYFKKIPDDQLEDPGEQLQKVLAFKERISTTYFYKEFESERILIELVQDALHDWIIKNRGKYETPAEASKVITLQPNDKEALVCVLKQGLSSAEAISSEMNLSTSTTKALIQRLQNLGLIVEEGQEMLKPINSMVGFLAIARHLNTDAHHKTLLSSQYFQNMFSSSIGAHILRRFHCELSTNAIECLRCLAFLSSSVTAYLLFGDTSFYDKVFENAKDEDEEARDLANGFLQDKVILCALLEYGADYTKGMVLHELNSKRLAGQLLSMNLKVAYEEAKAFEIGVDMPLNGEIAKRDLKTGEMFHINPEFRIRQGTILMHLDLDELAEQRFDQALSQEIPDKAKAIALNNKGLIYMKRNRFVEAIALFEQALSQEIPDNAKVVALNNKGLIYMKHNRFVEAIALFEQAIKCDPTIDEPERNLVLAKARLSEQQENKET